MKKHSQSGFTLVELMIATAVIAILAAIAVPGYQESVRKTRRADAEGSLLALANAMERQFTANNSYCDTGPTASAAVVAAANTCGGAANDVGLSPGSLYAPPSNTSQYYEISISAATASTYTLTADPIGGQVNDKCGDLTLTSRGEKGQQSSNAAECWKN